MSAVRTMPFPPDLGHLAAIRRFVLTAADDLGARVDRNDLALIASELAANAALHANSPAEVRVEVTDDGEVLLEVRDGSPVLPRVVVGEPWDATGHRGMVLVEALSLSWGAETSEAGKRVWAHLAAAPVSQRTAAPPG